MFIRIEGVFIDNLNNAQTNILDIDFDEVTEIIEFYDREEIEFSEDKFLYTIKIIFKDAEDILIQFELCSFKQAAIDILWNEISLIRHKEETKKTYEWK